MFATSHRRDSAAMPPLPAISRPPCLFSAPKSTSPAHKASTPDSSERALCRRRQGSSCFDRRRTSCRAAPPGKSAAVGYAKVRLRGAIDFPLAGVAVALAASGPNVNSLRIALTGTNSRPFLACRYGSLCRPTNRRKAVARARSACAKASPAHAHHDCIGQLSSGRSRCVGSAPDRKTFR